MFGEKAIFSSEKWLSSSSSYKPAGLPWASLVAQMVKNLPAVQETGVWSLGREDPLEKKMATHSSILTWRCPWMEESGGLQSMGWETARHDWATAHTRAHTHTHTHTHTYTLFWHSFLNKQTHHISGGKDKIVKRFQVSPVPCQQKTKPSGVNFFWRNEKVGETYY